MSSVTRKQTLRLLSLSYQKKKKKIPSFGMTTTKGLKVIFSCDAPPMCYIFDPDISEYEYFLQLQLETASCKYFAENPCIPSQYFIILPCSCNQDMLDQ